MNRSASSMNSKGVKISEDACLCICICVILTNFQHSDHAGAIVHCLSQKSSVLHNLSCVKSNCVGYVPQNSAKRNFGRLWNCCIHHFSSLNLEVKLQGNWNLRHQTTIQTLQKQSYWDAIFWARCSLWSHDGMWSSLDHVLNHQHCYYRSRPASDKSKKSSR